MVKHMLFNPFGFLFASDEINSLNFEEFKQKITSDKDVVVIDVRTLQEYNQVRIPNSSLIDFHNPDFRMEIDKLDKTKTYLVYCRSGRRSYHACREFKHQGFGKVFNLEGGIIAWKGDVLKG